MKGKDWISITIKALGYRDSFVAGAYFEIEHGKEQWSMQFKDALKYAIDEMDDCELRIIHEKAYRNDEQHKAPATGIDTSRFISLIEKYGEEHNLPKGWYLNEYDADGVVMLLL